MKQLLIYLLLLCLPLSSCISEHEDGAPSGNGDLIHVGDMLPNFKIGLVNGDTLTTASLLGAPSVIVFFHTGCGDCRRELTHLQRVYEECGSKVRFLCIGRDEPLHDADSYWQRAKLTLPRAGETGRSTYSLFALHTVPRIYISDCHGRVHTIFVEKMGREALQQTLRSQELYN